MALRHGARSPAIDALMTRAINTTAATAWDASPAKGKVEHLAKAIDSAVRAATRDVAAAR
jgi:hypothetical protein